MLVAGVVLVVIALGLLSITLAIGAAGASLIAGGVAVAAVEDRNARRKAATSS